METKEGRPPADVVRQLQGVRVWVVEDDPEWRTMVVGELGRHGAVARGIGSVQSLYRELAVERCDILLLDIALPGEDGLSAARHLRRIDDMGIVLVAGHDSAADMAQGLSAGADCFLSRPLELPVLMASLGSLRRRMAVRAGGARAEAQGMMAVVPVRDAGNGWSLGAGGWELWAPNGRFLVLSLAERVLMGELFSAPGTPVGRERLIAALTPTPWDFDPHRLEVLVHRLRARVRAATGLTLPIRALRGVGYLLVPAQS